MPRCTPCIIPYNGKVRQESLQFREPMTAGVVLFTKSSREGHDFAAIILYPILVPNEMTYLFFLPLLFSNTHRQKTLTPPRSGSSVVYLSLRGAQRRGNPFPRPPCLPLRGRCPRRGGEGRPLPQVTEGSLKLSKYSKTRTPAPKRPGLPLKKRIKMKRTVSCEVYDTKKLLTNPTSNVT